MKLIHKVSPKLLLICVSAVVLLAVTAGSVWAYFKTATRQADNQFTPGIIDIQITEPTGSSYTVSSDNSVNKEIQIQNVWQNEHSAPAYVRVKLVPIMRWTNGDGSGDAVNVSYTVNENNWADGGDGFYYYKGVLKPNDISPKLITKATVQDGIPSGKKLEIQAIADAVQVSDDAAKSAWGMKYDGSTWAKTP